MIRKRRGQRVWLALDRIHLGGARFAKAWRGNQKKSPVEASVSPGDIEELQVE